MLERLLEQQKAVTLVLAGVPTVKNLSAQQWSTAADLTATLRPFMDVTTLMSGAAYPTVSMILPVVDGLKDLLRSTTGGLDVLRDVFVRLVDERFGDGFADPELCAATVVDPRFKTAPFDDQDRRQRALSYTVQAMEETVAADAPSPSPSPQPTASSSVMSIWSKLDRNISATAAPGRSRESIQHELDLFVAEPTIHRDQCPLQWWAANQKSYPLVAEIARRLLAIPATSVPSERLFSKAGDVITKKRNRLDPTKADRVIFLMENL